MDAHTTKKGKWMDTNFKSNLAQAWCCPISLLSFTSIEQSIFKLESRNQNISNEHTPKVGMWTDPNFKSNQALVVSSHPVFKLIVQSIFKWESRSQKISHSTQGWAHKGTPMTKASKPWWCAITLTDSWTTRQVSLIIRLVTCKPPN